MSVSLPAASAVRVRVRVHGAAELARRLVRLGLNRGVRTATGPVRALARFGRTDADPRWPDASWLWQPGWGRFRHDRLYRTPDPYRIGLSAYEQEKYDRVMSALDGRRYERALEIGCGEGDLTERLVGVCDDLLAVDISSAATARAAERVPSARVETRMLPAAMPPGRFDLIVCSDVLYYWEPTTLRVGLDRLVDALTPGGLLLAFHYRGDFGQAGTADAVHDRIGGLVSTGRVRAVHGERMDGMGPGGEGALFDVVGSAESVPPA